MECSNFRARHALRAPFRLNVMIKRFALENVRAGFSSWVARYIHHRRPREFSELLQTGSLKRLFAHATAGPHR